MNEQVLKSLLQLFAFIAKQCGILSKNELEYVHLFLKEQITESSIKEYYELFDKYTEEIITSQKSSSDNTESDIRETENISNGIKDILSLKQKITTITKLFEFIYSDNNSIAKKILIIERIASVFKISNHEFELIKTFVSNNNANDFDSENFLILENKEKSENKKYKHITEYEFDGQLIVLNIKSVDIHLFKYIGESEIFLDGIKIANKKIYILAKGSSLKLPKSKPILYTHISEKFLEDVVENKIFFHANNVKYIFKDGYTGIHNVNIYEGSGKMVGIMGSNGAGKTTLLNILSGINLPSEGEVLINGIDIHKNKEQIKGLIGYVPQDDLLIEDLTVFQNLYYNAKLVFKELSKFEIRRRVVSVIKNLGLNHIKDLKVGSPLDKKISGGERKRLNIGLELIREPSVLFVDEPTSGLSSRDTEPLPCFRSSV